LPQRFGKAAEDLPLGGYWVRASIAGSGMRPVPETATGITTT
jgi:hypothetical protein